MLRNVLENYISNISERDFDLPFLSLLPQFGFFDIHYTHGQVEFGKDFIAKKVIDGIAFQYSFQSKAGDISQTDWRNNVMGQMLEGNIIGLSHPNFDKSLQHQSVLVTTGKLIGNTALSLQDFNQTLIEKYQKLPVALWDKEDLLNKLETNSFTSLHNETSAGFVTFGNFYVLYGNSIKEKLNLEELENHFLSWAKENIDSNKKIFGITLESEILARKAKSLGFLYEGIYIYLCLLRAVLREIGTYPTSKDKVFFISVYLQTKEKIKNECSSYFDTIKNDWEQANKEAASLVNGIESIITYPINCLRAIEVVSLFYFLETDTEKRKNILHFLQEFMEKEPGVSHIPSDNYAVSLVLPIIILKNNNFINLAKNILQNALIWLCDRYENGYGLAEFGSSAQEEVNMLLGYSFESIDVQKTNESFSATVLLDLIASLKMPNFYEVAVNDIKAINIFPQYWQIPDSDALYFIDERDIVSYPNIDYQDKFGEFENFNYADHVLHELDNYKILSDIDPICLFSLMLLLRDRYFPKLWKLLT